jgi:hypothetical protein
MVLDWENLVASWTAVDPYSNFRRLLTQTLQEMERHAVECEPASQTHVARPPVQGLNFLNMEQSRAKALYEHRKPSFGPTI